MVDYPVIDADGHVFEPFEMWDRYLPDEFTGRSFGYQGETDGRTQVSIDELEFEIPYAIGDFATPGGLTAEGARGRGYTEINPAAYEGPARLALMDDMGIDVSVLYPTQMLVPTMLSDPGVRRATMVAYGEWMADLCAKDPRRLKWVAPLTREDVEFSAEHVGRSKALGACGVFVPTAPTLDGRLLGDPADDPILEAIADADLPLAVHISDPQWDPAWGLARLIPNELVKIVAGDPLQQLFAFAWMFTNRAFDRFPDQRVAFVEGDAGWLPYWLDKLERSAHHTTSLYPLPEATPLEVFRRQCWIGPDADEGRLTDVAELVGGVRCLWSSDFPHHEASWNPVEELLGRDDVDHALAREMLSESAIAFYGFEPGDLPG